MAINGLEIKENGIVYENEDRIVLGVFNDDEEGCDSFPARNGGAFIVKKMHG